MLVSRWFSKLARAVLFFDLLRGWLEEPQGSPLGVGIQPCHRPSKGQRFIMLEPQDFSHHRRSKRQQQSSIHHKLSLNERPLLRKRFDHLISIIQMSQEQT